MKEFWRAAGTRALRTMAQTAIAMIGTAVVLSELDPRYIISGMTVAGILSVCSSIVSGLPEVSGTDTEED